MAVHEVNARRLLCPIPVIRTQDAINGLSEGDEVHVFGTDPGIKQDIPAWCKVNGHRVIDIIDREDDIEVIVEVGSGQ